MNECTVEDGWLACRETLEETEVSGDGVNGGVCKSSLSCSGSGCMWPSLHLVVVARRYYAAMHAWSLSCRSAVHMWSLSRGIPVRTWLSSRRGTEHCRCCHAGAQVPCGRRLVGAWGPRCHRCAGALRPCFRPCAQVLWTCRRRAEVLQ